MRYCEVSFIIDPLLPAREVLLAELAERGFESFVETDQGLLAYIIEDNFSEDMLDELMSAEIPDQKLSFDINVIPEQNWNEEWEKQFQPIIVDELCLIRAPFHKDLGHYQYEIVIEPKMSFGTGHHATTHLIMSQMLKMDFNQKVVLDMGCGTGVLAILAGMRGASGGDAIDIDQWSYENTIENFERNNCHNFRVIKGGAEAIPSDVKYDIVLANINRNILTRDMAQYAKAMNANSKILFSGFYASDQQEIDAAAVACGLSFNSKALRDEWCMLVYSKE